MAYIFDIAKVYDRGEITIETVEGLLTDLYGPENDSEKQTHRDRVIRSGEINKLALIGLNARVREIPHTPAAPTVEPIPEAFLRDVPDPVYEEGSRPDLAAEIKRRLGIIAAVRKYGKAQPRIVERGVEGIKVRCPFPDHPDHNPSAWVNTEKNTWYCGKCTVGGDVIDFYAAIHEGLRPADFHRDSDRFPAIVSEMGETLGIRAKKEPSSGDWFVEDDHDPLPSAAPDAEEEVVAPERPVPVELEARFPGEDGEPVDPEDFRIEPVVPESPEAGEPVTITDDEMLRGVVPFDDEIPEVLVEEGDPLIYEWRDLHFAEGSFMDLWMRKNEEELPWVPPEFFMMLGFQAISLACGQSLSSTTGLGELGASTMMLLIGHSGEGKSKAVNRLKRLLRDVAPFDPSTGNGVKQLASPASPEALLKMMMEMVEDTTGDIPKYTPVPVTAWLHEDEFATLVDRTKRRGGNVLKTRIIGLHDFVKTRLDPELVAEDESAGGGKRGVYDSFFAATFLTQPDAIRSLTERVDLFSGFLSRIVPVYGKGRSKLRYAIGTPFDPDPLYREAYTKLWSRCRKKSLHQIPFTEDALELADESPFMEKVRRLLAAEPVYSRVAHNVFRFAFLLAVNDDASQIDAVHVNRAIHLCQYVAKCYARMTSAVIATQANDNGEAILKFVRDFYSRTKRWPMNSDWASDRSSYRNIPREDRNTAREDLFKDGALVEIRIKSGRAVQKVMIVPEKEWAGWATCHGKTFNMEDVYGAID